MPRIISDEKLNQFRLMMIDGEKTQHYTHYKIGNEIFKPVPMHNMEDYVAIESDVSHLGQTLEFVNLK